MWWLCSYFVCVMYIAQFMWLKLWYDLCKSRTFTQSNNRTTDSLNIMNVGQEWQLKRSIMWCCMDQICQPNAKCSSFPQVKSKFDTLQYPMTTYFAAPKLSAPTSTILVALACDITEFLNTDNYGLERFCTLTVVDALFSMCMIVIFTNSFRCVGYVVCSQCFLLLWIQ